MTVETTNVYASNYQWLGIALEDSWGVAPAGPTAWIPVTSPTYTPVPQLLSDQALRGMNGVDYGQQIGMITSTFSYTTYLYADSVFSHLAAILGPDTVTGDTAPYTHTASLLNNGQPPSYTLFYNDGSGSLLPISGAKASSVKFTIKSGGLVELAVSWVAKKAGDPVTGVNTPTTAIPMPAWTALISIAGNQYTKYSEVDWEFKRATAPITALTGTQDPSAIFAPGLEVDGTFTGIYQGVTDNDYANFLANTQPGMSIVVTNQNDDTHSLTLQFSQIAYQVASFSASSNYMEVKATTKALMNTTDATDGEMSPAKAILISTQSTAF